MTTQLTTVTGRYLGPDDSPAAGTVEFMLSASVYDADDQAIRPQVKVRRTLDPSGEFTVDLMPGQDTGVTIDGTLTYRVVERIIGAPHRSYYVEVPVGTSVDLGTLAPQGTPPAVTSPSGGAVDSVNGYTGTVVLAAADVGAVDTAALAAAIAVQAAADSGTFGALAGPNTWTGTQNFAGATVTGINTGSAITVAAPSGDTTGATDTTAIQAALNTAAANFLAGSGAVEVRLLGGTYWVKQSSGTDTTCCLSIGAGVTLSGSGWGTIVKMANSQPVGVTSIIKTATTAYQWTVRDLTVDGNVANNATAVNCEGLALYGNSQYVIANIGSGVLGVVDHVLVMNTKSNGMNARAGEIRISNCFVWAAQAVGFQTTGFDTYLMNCTAGACWTTGIALTDSCRAVGCKVYASGGTAGAITLSSGNELVGCEVQQCQFPPGIVIQGYQNIITGCRVEGVGGDALKFNNSGATGNRVDIQVNDKNFGDGHGNYLPTSAVNFATVGAGNTVRITQSGTTPSSGYVLGSPVGQDLTINQSANGFQSVAYAATVTPNPYAGRTVSIGTLTGAITIANPSQGHHGCQLRLILTQDATGGRTVTFGANYKTTAAIPTTLSTTTVIDFIYDGTYWHEVTRATA